MDQLQTSGPKPKALSLCSLNAVTDQQLVLHGGSTSADYEIDAQNDTWIFHLPSQTWKQYRSKKDYRRMSHTASTGVNSSAIIIGGKRDHSILDNYDIYTQTFH